MEEEENLWVAVQLGNIDVVGKLLESPQPEQDCRELLSTAVAHKLHKILELLLEHKVDPNIQNLSGKTVLHEAARSADEAAVKLLLDNKANPNILDNKGNTPIFYARTAAIFKLLLEHNTDIDLHNKAGESVRGLLYDPNLPPYHAHLPQIISDYLIREQWRNSQVEDVDLIELDDKGDLLGEDNLSSSEQVIS
jgi:ankyrin repeat protein